MGVHASTEKCEPIGGKTESRCEKVENNSNVSVFPSNPNHDNFYPLSFDLMPPLWAP